MPTKQMIIIAAAGLSLPGLSPIVIYQQVYPQHHNKKIPYAFLRCFYLIHLTKIALIQMIFIALPLYILV
ncbi:hypothetical protein EOQ21_05255, partial [Salmonella bongori serovar 48:i:-]|nr:hypothetical protein [Salmonella bongori serovar 48:i:-]